MPVTADGKRFEADRMCHLEENLKSQYDGLLSWFNSEEFGYDESCLMAHEPVQKMVYVIEREHDEQAFMDWLQGPHYDTRLIVCNNMLVGFMRARRKPWVDDHTGRKSLNVTELFVHPDHRGKGIGTWAIKRIFEMHPDIHMITGNALDQSFEFWENRGAYLSPHVVMGKRGLLLERGDFRER